MTATVVVPPGPFAENELTLEGASYRHLFRARRLQAGDPLRVVDGEGRARWASVESVGRRQARLALAGEAPANEPAHQLALWTALPRPERAAWLVEKATEVGVSAVRFLRCQRSERPLGEAHLARLRRVVMAAVEQCHRARVPEISGPHALVEVAAPPGGAARAFVLHPEAEASLPGGPGPWAVAVGPEGGWEPSELATLAEAGFSPVRLGQRALRVETAAVAAAAILLLGPSSPGHPSSGMLG